MRVHLVVRKRPEIRCPVSWDITVRQIRTSDSWLVEQRPRGAKGVRTVGVKKTLAEAEYLAFETANKLHEQLVSC